MHSGALARDTDGVNDIPTETVTGSATTATVAPIRGDVAADSGPNTLKHWMMSSAVIDIKPNAAFEFIAAERSTWRYDFTERDGTTSTTKSFSYPQPAGFPKLVRRRLLDGSKGMTTGMQAALDRIETSLRR